MELMKGECYGLSEAFNQRDQYSDFDANDFNINKFDIFDFKGFLLAAPGDCQLISYFNRCPLLVSLFSFSNIRFSAILRLNCSEILAQRANHI